MNPKQGFAAKFLAVGLLSAVGMMPLRAQTCTTPARLAADVRSGLSDVALSLAIAVQSGDSARVQAATIPEYATNFASTAYLVRTVSEKLAGDTLKVTQVYQLDALALKAGSTSDAEFACPLAGTTSETDFSISGLAAGLYGFAMVEATGPRPYLLAFLLEQKGGTWKMAGFYPRPRTAAGHNGLWYWNAARIYAKDKQLWLAWLFYGEADQLLRPANFATSTNLDKLRSEQRAIVPPELADGIGPETPLVVREGDHEYRFTSIDAEGSDDGKSLNLMLHLRADPIADPAAARARNDASAQALVDAHLELKQAFQSVEVFAESTGQNPFATEEKMQDIP